MELEALRKDMVAAMKAKDKVTKDAVSSLISAVKKVAIDEGFATCPESGQRYRLYNHQVVETGRAPSPTD